MTPEEMDRAIEFLIRQQAEFAAGVERSRQEHEESYRRLSDAILAVTGLVGSLGEAQERTELHLAELKERLDTFIAYVERYIDETRNGKNRN